MRLPTATLHDAQIVRIEANTAYTVYDENPEDAPFPYIVMGEIMARDWSDKSADGTEVYSTIHIWSQYHGRKEAGEMADALVYAFSLGPLNLSPNFRAALDRMDSYNLMVDIDGVTRHGILKFKYLIEEL